MLPEILFAQYSDGDIVEHRRCGDFPDLYASEQGGIILVHHAKIFPVNGSPCIKYRGNNTSARTLVADAWIKNWEQQGRQLEAMDGDRMNLSVANLRPTSGMRGRPPGSRLRFMAMIFQTYLKTCSITETADSLGLSDAEVRSAIAIFDPKMLNLSL